MSMDSPNDFTRTGSEADIERQLQQLREDIAALARSVAAAGTNKADTLKHKARRASHEAMDASAQALDSAKLQFQSMEKDLERQIRTKPLQSVAIAAGIGFLFAMLSRR
ncbi:YqjD family protein [Rhizobium helianthi]|uniref:YqjD family protein n=1 Tax=Rhizobium helianthi TaxID=1132695 RepID=A0ABW4M9A6_9HYPH